MTDLSPQAQAVLDASKGVFWRPVIDVPAFHNKSIAAALRVAVDQVVPVTSKPNDEFCCPPVATIVWNRVTEIRKQLIAIAIELESQ